MYCSQNISESKASMLSEFNLLPAAIEIESLKTVRPVDFSKGEVSLQLNGLFICEVI